MKLKNFANIPDDKIKEIIEFVKPNGLATPRYDVIVKNGHGGNGGHFYSSGELIVKYGLYPKTRAGFLISPKRAEILSHWIMMIPFLIESMNQVEPQDCIGKSSARKGIDGKDGIR